ncbi:MAG: hypothetical protein Q4G33_14760 [bacterium]|nr:hypothetical protein [bacterium]
MDSLNHNETSVSRGEVQTAEGESAVFLLRDKNHEFTIGVNDVLQCIRYAEERGAVPKLPDGWWDNLA